MKKFFGLKMTLAALAVVSFASCYDSESGDVIIPGQITLPDALYVVNGSVTNLETGAAVQNVTISGAISTTAANGYFEVTGSSPFSGTVEFSAEGYYDASRSIAQSTIGKSQSLISSLNVAMSPEGYIPNLTESVAGAPTNLAVETLTATQLAAAIASVDGFTNDTDDPVQVEFSPKDLGFELDWGAVVPVFKGELEDKFVDFVKKTWGNDPFKGYIVYPYTLKVVVPAHSVLSDLTITPIERYSKFSFTEEGEYFEQDVNIRDQYTVSALFESLEHGHGHGHGTETNAGGGSGE